MRLLPTLRLMKEWPKWEGVDLDGTLAHSLKDYSDPTAIGEPIASMVTKVKQLLGQGKTVKIFTARMADKKHAAVIKKAIGDWTEKYIGQRLEATHQKDPGCMRIWDDRAVGVTRDKGITGSTSRQGRKYYVQDTRYKHAVSEHDDPEEAEKAAIGRPYSRVVSEPNIETTPALRDIARRRMVRTNPDVD